jgi:hypothetical protein
MHLAVTSEFHFIKKKCVYNKNYHSSKLNSYTCVFVLLMSASNPYCFKKIFLSHKKIICYV